MADGIRYAFDGEPTPGEIRQVAPGVHWLRMPLPFKLDHINLWLLEDGPGWTIVDTGLNSDETRDAWQRIFANHLDGRPVTRVIATHFHPDHMGLIGWLTDHWQVDVWATLGEWAFARLLSLDSSDAYIDGVRAFYHAAGFDDELLSMLVRRGNQYQKRTGSIPTRYHRLREGDTVDVGGRGWRILIGAGHSPEHACLYCEELGVLISGDQVLPKITPNISVWHQEPDADPLSLFLGSLPQFRELPAETLVLPSHNWPFTGLHARVDELAHHHDARLVETLASCDQPRTGMDFVSLLFKRQLDSHTVVFALGESLAHLHLLLGRGDIERRARGDGVNLYAATAAFDDVESAGSDTAPVSPM